MASQFSVTNTSGAIYTIAATSGGISIAPRPVYIDTPPIDTSMPGDQDVPIVVTNPTGDPSTGGLVPGQVVDTPNGDGTITVIVGGDGTITYPPTNDPTAPGYNPIRVIGPGGVDVSDNYDLDNSWNHLKDVPVPDVPSAGAGFIEFGENDKIVLVVVMAVVLGGVVLVFRNMKYAAKL
jgi:hypothetical protein